MIMGVPEQALIVAGISSVDVVRALSYVSHLCHLPLSSFQAALIRTNFVRLLLGSLWNSVAHAGM